MKKFLVLIVFLIFSQAAYANFIPQYSTSIKYWGIGAVFVNHQFAIYEKPDENSQIIKKIKWGNSKDIICDGQCNSHHSFVAFYPSKDYAILSANDEIEGWAQVYYDQQNGLLGWVKLHQGEKFMTWANFIKTYGKMHGYFLFKDIKKDERKLYAQPENTSRSVDSWEIAKNITPWYIKGNWMMAKVLNYDNTIKTGWLKWRDEDGKLRGFVNFRN